MEVIISVLALWTGVLVWLLLLAFVSFLLTWFSWHCSKEITKHTLRSVRLITINYWNTKMEKEGLIACSNFYKEQVRIHKPTTIQEFSKLDKESTQQDL